MFFEKKFLHATCVKKDRVTLSSHVTCISVIAKNLPHSISIQDDRTKPSAYLNKAEPIASPSTPGNYPHTRAVIKL